MSNLKIHDICQECGFDLWVRVKIFGISFKVIKTQYLFRNKTIFSYGEIVRLCGDCAMYRKHLLHVKYLETKKGELF